MDFGRYEKRISKVLKRERRASHLVVIRGHFESKEARSTVDMFLNVTVGRYRPRAQDKLQKARSNEAKKTYVRALVM